MQYRQRNDSYRLIVLVKEAGAWDYYHKFDNPPAVAADITSNGRHCCYYYD